MMVMKLPSKNRPTALIVALTITAPLPAKKRNGSTGMVAPPAKRRKEVMAASQGEPPSSSRVNVSRAVLGSYKSCFARLRASASGIPLA